MSDHPNDRKYLIRKRGYWYRPGSSGYTSSAIQAGRYTLKQAMEITHPNGLDGPRDEMGYYHENTINDEDWRSYVDLSAKLDAAEAQLAQRDAQVEALEAAIKRQAGASRTLRAHTLAEVQNLKDLDRSEYNAAKSLDSEREANAILTAQVEALTAERDALRADDCDPDGCAAHISAFASRVDALTAQLAQRDAALKAADDLAAISQALCDGYGFASDGGDNYREVRTTDIAALENAFTAYRKARGQDA